MKKVLPPLLLFTLSLALYGATLAPTVVTIFDDSLELQLALPRFAIVHPTGYPLYTLLGWLITHLVPVGDVAWRVNFFSAVAAATTITLLYTVARRLGGATVPAFVAALLLAVGPVWWSQATIAEVYALQGLLTLLIIWALLRWETDRLAARSGAGWLALVGFSIGLGLAHHRLTLLLMPAALIFMLWTDPGLIRRPRAWVVPILALLLPLALYGILPLRASVGSLDDSYAAIGFWGWVMGGGYSTFLADNPLGIDRNLGDLLDVWVKQYGLLGILVAVVGYPLWQMQPRRFVLLSLIALADLLFARFYQVADVEVFLIPFFIVWALFIAVGLTVLWDAALTYAAAWGRRTGMAGGRIKPAQILSPLFALILLLWPISLAAAHLPAQDRSHPPARAWGVHDLGRDMLDSIARDSTLVGLLGEMTLVRYFQHTRQLRPDVATIAADTEPERLAAIAASVAAGKPTFTTRPLAGLAETFSLSAVGPLVRVSPPGENPTTELDQPVQTALTPEVTLAGWDIYAQQPPSGLFARLSLLWQAQDRPPTDFKISARLLDGDGAVLAQRDDFPVHNTYPPTRWRPGETIRDSYDLPLAMMPDGPVQILIILYDPETGAELGRWQQPVQL